MQGKSLIIFVACFVAFANSAILEYLDPCEYLSIDEKIPSTVCISARVCATSCSNATAQAFYSCYDQVPSKDIFLRCQTEAFHRELDSKANIQALCFKGEIKNIGQYGDCLKREFNDEAARAEAVKTVNQCQAKKVGLNDSLARYHRPHVERLAYRHARELELGSRPEFLNLNSNEMEILLKQVAPESSTATTNESERHEPESLSEFYFSIYKWMVVDRNLRTETFCAISAEFPLSQVDADILCKIFKEDNALRQNSVCIKLYFRAIERKYFQDREKYRSCSLPVSPIGVPVVQSSSQDSLAKQNNLEGRQLGAPSKTTGSVSMEGNMKRSVESREIEFLEVVPAKRIVIAEVDLTESDVYESTSGSSSGPKMYFISRFSPPPRNLLEMNLTDFSTKKVVEFPFAEDSPCLMHHDNKIFAICSRGDSAENQVLGGLAAGQIVASIEKFWDPFSVVNGHWLKVGDFPHPRAGHAVGLIGDQIYVVGGVTSTKARIAVTSCMDAFDIGKKTWSRKAPMPSRKTGHCVAVVNSRLYAIGGGGSVEMRKETKCAVYQPETNLWNLIAPLNQARQHGSAFVLDGSIYIVGGNLGPPTMEKYDVLRNTWTLVDNCKLPTEGIYHHVARPSPHSRLVSPAIRQAVIPFLWKNIKELGARPEFLYLNPDEVNSLLPVATDVNTLRNLLLDSESEFYSELLLSIFNWMNVDPIHRLDHFIAVSLKFPLASKDRTLVKIQVKIQDKILVLRAVKVLERTLFPRQPNRIIANVMREQAHILQELVQKDAWKIQKLNFWK
ncbi:unnamed protein product [Allacma fusca]|uniref:Uncharacterized protein n=1 Tax=Allacma fusca TaxID=39272 RepID=A0A8J2P5V7_9HEXA|nr:unnamed protein product [Allacma fusca]